MGAVRQPHALTSLGKSIAAAGGMAVCAAHPSHLIGWQCTVTTTPPEVGHFMDRIDRAGRRLSAAEQAPKVAFEVVEKLVDVDDIASGHRLTGRRRFCDDLGFLGFRDVFQRGFTQST